MAFGGQTSLYAYSDDAALRASRRIILQILPLLAILVLIQILFSWRRSTQKPLLDRLLRLLTPVSVSATIAAFAFGAMRYRLAKKTFSCSPDAFTAGGITILRSSAPRLDIQPSFFTIQHAGGPAVRVQTELDNYPELLESLRSWNLPDVTTRDTSFRRLAIIYAIDIAAVVALLMLFFR